MIFTDIAAGTAVFIDANIFIYYFSPHPTFGPACRDLLDRIENQEITGFTSAHVTSSLAHRLMTLEANMTFGWPLQGIASKLKRHPADVQQLTRYRQAFDEINAIGVQVLPITGQLVSKAADVSRQFGLLADDALVVTVMTDKGLNHLASHDADFDRVTGLTRFAPV